MNHLELETILIGVQKLTCNKDNLSLANDLKKRTLDNFRISFPTETILFARIERLIFEPKMVINGDNLFSDFGTFERSKFELIEILKDKILFIKKMRKSEESGTIVSKILKRIEEEAPQRTTEYTLRTSLIKAMNDLKDSENSNHELKDRIVKAKRMTIFKDLGVGLPILGGAFLLGGFFGNSKFDNDKNKMVDEIRAYKITIDSLKKINSIELLKNK